MIAFESQELFWLYRILGQARAGGVLADAEHRLQVLDLCAFTEEERERLDYEELPTDDGQWRFQFKPGISLEREFTDRQKQKVIELVAEALPTLSLTQFRIVRGALIKLGWEPPSE